MDGENIVIQGSDEDFEFDIFDNNGNPLDVSPAGKMYVLLYYSGFLTPQFKFSLTAATGYNLFTSNNADHAAGKIKIKLQSNQTGPADPGKLYAEIGIRFSDITRTDDVLYDIIQRDIYTCTIKKSLTPITTLP